MSSLHGLKANPRSVHEMKRNEWICEFILPSLWGLVWVSDLQSEDSLNSPVNSWRFRPGCSIRHLVAMVRVRKRCYGMSPQRQSYQNVCVASVHMTEIHMGMIRCPAKTRNNFSLQGCLVLLKITTWQLLQKKRERKADILRILKRFISVNESNAHPLRRGHMTWEAWRGCHWKAPRSVEGPCGHFADRRSSVLQQPEKPEPCKEKNWALKQRFEILQLSYCPLQCFCATMLQLVVATWG